MELSQETQISTDSNTKGFDLLAGKNWIYPLNYQFREYQYNIAENALFNNTLVCLPTGLGKTLIAAVVMYNFWRWYPRGKIVFLAPTKPLVAQQISACHDIMGIPSADTIELTGATNLKNRQVAWFTKRVVFATPQVFQNDLEKDIVSGELVRCVVIDEAHKALGKHSYCESLRLLQTRNTCFRVLALSATPGSKLEDVCQVMKNLFISHLELRDETSPDIIPYLNKRQMDIILVPLDKDLARFKEQYVSIMDRYVRLLVQYNVLKGDASTISKGRIFYVYKDFQSKTNRPGNYGQIMKTISRCISLYHAYELLIRHGLRTFATFCETHSSDIWMTDEPALQNLVKEIHAFLGPLPNVHPLPNGSVEEIPADVVFGHTKFHKLKSLLVEHFEKFAAKNEDTRAIVFVEYRDSVNEVYVSLLQLRPILRPKMFVGQAGQKQKQQMQAMEAFRKNEANVLISTSVGEEGLDVGEVDLIVCFDISQSSPIRLVQRMGRTGRRRDGRIIMLVTDGKEHQALKSTLARRDSLNKKVLHSSNVVSALYQESPRMVPLDIKPVCSKMHIVLQPKTPTGKGKRKRKVEGADLPKKSKKRAIGAKNHAEFSQSEGNEYFSRKENKKENIRKNSGMILGDVEKVKPGQSSMLQFLKKPSTSKEPNEVSTLMSRLSQTNQQPIQITQSNSIKLFASDAAVLEFLTLCAIKASKIDESSNELNQMDKTYLAISPHDDSRNFFDYPIPDLSILNCIQHLEQCIESKSPEFIEDFGFDEMDNDVYVPECNELDNIEYQDTNDSPAVGKFNYEDLFADSSESSEVLPENGESLQRRSNEELINVEDRLTGDENDDLNAALLEYDHLDEQGIAVGLDGQEPEDNSLLKVGCFESILDQSSDSDIPPSQGEIDLRRSIQMREESAASCSLSKNQIGSPIERSTKTRTTSSAGNAMFDNQNNTYPIRPKANKSNLNSSEINKRLDVNNAINGSDGRALCLPEVSDYSVKVNTSTDTSSRFFQSKRIKCSNSSIGLESKTEACSIVVEPVEAISSRTSVNYENIDKNFKEPLDEDDDVIFVGEVTVSTSADNTVKNTVPNLCIKNNDKIVLEREVSFTRKKKENESKANSSKYTITQIIDLIESSTSQKVNLSKISKNLPNLSQANKLKQISTPTATPSLKHNETVPKTKSNISDASVSCYFSNENHSAEKLDASLQVDEPLVDELDLSDIKWEDDFVDNKERLDSNKVSEKVNLNLSQSKADDWRSRLLNKKEESFKTNSDSSGLFFESKMQTEKVMVERSETGALNTKKATFEANFKDTESSPSKSAVFDLGDFEWDSDFETPANPVASRRQFGNPNNTSSPNKPKAESASGSVSHKSSLKSTQPTKLSSFRVSLKKKLSTQKGKTLKPSTSRDFSDDGNSDFEEDFLCKFDGKYKNRRDRNPNINYLLTTNGSSMASRELKLLQHEKENTEPNSGIINRGSFSVGRKDENVKSVPLSRRVAVLDRQKYGSLNGDSHKRKKIQRRNRVKSAFLDHEAEIYSDTTSGSSGEDDDLEGFVSHTQHVPEIVDMQGHYLQSIKDVHEPNGFHLRTPRAFVPDEDVFSQHLSEVDESAYVYDSFCVSGGEDDFSAKTDEDSILQLSERVLNSKKRKHSKNGKASVSKKRKVSHKLSDTNSSEDETEKLRNQILEESMNLKQNRN